MAGIRPQYNPSCALDAKLPLLLVAMQCKHTQAQVSALIVQGSILASPCHD